jgi:hypothetical protein
VLAVAQIAISFVILVAAGLFVRTFNKLHSVQLGYARENILLFSLNARQAGHRDPEIAIFYADLRKRFESIPGVSSATLSQSSIISAGRAGSPGRVRTELIYRRSGLRRPLCKFETGQQAYSTAGV